MLAIDPGETCGFAKLSYRTIQDVEVSTTWNHAGLPLAEFVAYLKSVLRILRPIDLVVVEDYVIYASAAQLHIGQQLVTPKLIGAIEAVCALQMTPMEVVLIPAAKKGRWSDVRINIKFPRMLSALDSEHEKDAVKLGLAYIEGKYL